MVRFDIGQNTEVVVEKLNALLSSLRGENVNWGKDKNSTYGSVSN
jgi:hypothetical protein